MKHALLLALAAIPTANAALSISLSGNVESAGWHELGIGYAGNTWAADGYPTSYPGAAPWPAAVAPNVSGSTASAELMKESGNGYFSGSSIYDAGSPGTFSVSDASPLAGLETIVLQIDAGATPGVTPVLHFNGGSQALAADFATTVDGDYTANGFTGPYPTTNHVWQWDLSGVVDPITRYEITWGSVASNHLSQYEVKLTAGDTFTQVIPEPSALLLSFGGLALAFRRRR